MNYSGTHLLELSGEIGGSFCPSLAIDLRLRWVLNADGLVAENAVLVAMVAHLLTKALGVVDVVLVAVEPADVVATPDSLQADAAVEELTLLEEESSVG